ncbi:MAG TPA: ATP-binding protein [Gemmatimonadaceae bacterium]|nr:ATP-binding protein [Gemmatimonadaceae bacterium]
MTDPVTQPPLILVADDVPANVELLHDQLSVLGYRVVSAEDGPSAIEACFEFRPDLCILDISMPAGALGVDHRSTGFEVCRRIKRDPRSSRIPVIFVTALNDTSDRVKAIEAGGDDFLTKPHSRQILSARVRSLLRLKFATDALEQSYRQLRELEKVRDDLMKMIVHDLKTPLAAVLASLEMVLDGDFGLVSEAQRRALSDAESQAEDLLALIEDLLEVARIEDTELQLEVEPIAPGVLLTEVMHEWAVRFQQEGAVVAMDVADEAPVFRGDKGMLKRVFSNLIQNALTHCPEHVHVSLSARRGNNGILFTVSDNGPGIPPEYHEIIFRKFERVKHPETPRVRSSGLGLAFCKLAVEAHGGRVWVQSSEGSGSHFHIALPLDPCGPASSDGERHER